MCFPSVIRGFEVTGCHAFKLTGSLHPYSAKAGGGLHIQYTMCNRGELEMMDRRGSWIWMESRWDAPSFEERKEENRYEVMQQAGKKVERNIQEQDFGGKLLI